MLNFSIDITNEDYNNSFFRPAHGDWEAEYCTSPAAVLQYAVQRVFLEQQNYYNKELSNLKQEIYLLKQEIVDIKNNIHHNQDNKHDIIRLYNTIS